MAFDFNNLIINRNTFISPDKIIDNNYFSNDSIKTIESPNYFPAYFGFDDNSVVIGDCIKIISTSDNLIKEYMVISVNPLVLSNVSAPGETQYIKVETSGAVSIFIPMLFYINNLNLKSFFIPGKFNFKTTNKGNVYFNLFDLNVNLIPQFESNLFFPAYSDNKPISLVLDLSPQVPIMKLTNDFSIGESIDFKNIFSSYL